MKAKLGITRNSGLGSLSYCNQKVQVRLISLTYHKRSASKTEVQLVFLLSKYCKSKT